MRAMTAAAHIDLLGDDAPAPAPAAVPVLPGEYVPASYSRSARETHTVMVLPPDPAMMGQKYQKLHTQNKIRQSFMQLAQGNIDAVQTWLHNVAADSPAKAVELFIELAKFSLPQLRETSVNVNQGGVSRTFTSSQDILAELEKPE